MRIKYNIYKQNYGEIYVERGEGGNVKECGGMREWEVRKKERRNAQTEAKNPTETENYAGIK